MLADGMDGSLFQNSDDESNFMSNEIAEGSVISEDLRHMKPIANQT